VTAVLIVLAVAVVVLLAVTLHLARRGSVAESGESSQPSAPSVPVSASAVPPRPANVAVVTLYELWMSRVEREKLGAGDDAWTDLTGTPQYATWQRLAEARGVADDVQHYMTRGLLSEVLYAAGGVERELGQLRKAVNAGQQLAAREAPRPTVLLQGQPAPAAQRQPIGGPYAAVRPVREASYSFVNLLSWARSAVERTDRPFRPGSSGRAGLLPALRPGELRDTVESALQHLRTALKDSRSLSSYAFHTGAIPAEGTQGSGPLPDGDTLGPPAYSLTDTAPTGEALQFAEDRDMLTYAAELMDAVEAFVNEVLDAFAASETVTL
jgi:hypothetical protein